MCNQNDDLHSISSSVLCPSDSYASDFVMSVICLELIEN